MKEQLYRILEDGDVTKSGDRYISGDEFVEAAPGNMLYDYHVKHFRPVTIPQVGHIPVLKHKYIVHGSSFVYLLSKADLAMRA